MPKLTITEFLGQVSNERGGLSPIAGLPYIASQAVTICTSFAQSAALDGVPTLIRVATHTDCHSLAGTKPNVIAA